MKFGSSNFVTFQEEGHLYTDQDQKSYRSVSKLLNSIEVPFDVEAISMAMARKKQKEGDRRELHIIQAEIKAEWKKIGEETSAHGTWIHNQLEDYHKLGSCDPKMNPVISQLRLLYTAYFKVFTEVLLYDVETQLAGQTDLVVQRQQSKNSLFDFYDYKTNIRKGIIYDSINRKKDPWQHYNKFFLTPLEHLEDCNYNRYALQLSVYAHMAQKTYGIKVGKLAIIFISEDLRVKRIPLPYMKLEAEALLQHGNNLKQLPQ